MERGDLLVRFRHGDHEAIAAVGRLAKAMVGEHGYYVPLGDREDVVQEILIDVHRAVSAPGFRLRRGFDGLVRAVAHRRCVDWMRHHRPVVPVATDAVASNPGPDRVLLDRERIGIVRLVVRSLGPSCRRLLHLRIARGFSYRRIAERLGRTELGLRVQMHKCLERARDVLAELTSDGRTSG